MIKIPTLELVDITGDNVQEEFLRFHSIGEMHRYQMAEDEQFYLGNQLTEAQVRYLKRLGQSDQPNNKIKPAAEQVLANVASSSPEWETTPTGQTDNEMSFVVNQQMKEIWRKSSGDVHFRREAKDFIVKGLTYGYIYPDWNADGGLGGLRLMRLNPLCVYVDPSTTEPDFSNATSIIYSDIETKDSLKAQYPQYADLIEKAENSTGVTDNTLATMYSRDNITVKGDIEDWEPDKLRKYFRFSPVSVPYVKVTMLDTGFWKIYDDKQYEVVENNKEYRKAVKNEEIQERIIYKTHYRQMLFFGNQNAEDGVLPVSICPIQPACNEFTDSPYPSGDVRTAKAPQRKLNRTEALLIAHATSTAGTRFGYEEGAMEKDQLSKLNLPGRVPIRFNPGGLSGKRVHEFGVSPVNTELYHEKGRYTEDIQEIFAAYKLQQGNPAGAPGTVGEAALLDEAAARKQNFKMLPLYDMLTNLGKVAVEWMPYVYDEQRTLRLVNPDGSEKNVILNQFVTDKTDVVKKIYDMQSLQVDIKVKVGSARAKTPLASLKKDLILKDAGVYDNTQVILNLEEPVDKESLLSRMSENIQLKNLAKQQEEQIKQLTGNLERRTQELFHTKMDAKVSNESKKIIAAVESLKTELEVARRTVNSDKNRASA
ncbi:hypothetical protein LCGC14_0364860 [marine sediment metagenome]|uniref:Portal protein n=1 Tax=marine sediment metagenome TaxID=412755 RepID=A0A0F9TCR7_9ZZZZ